MADFDKSTFDPKAAAEARKKEMDQMAEKLEAGVRYAPIRLQIEQLNTIYRAGDQGKEHSSIRSCTARYRSTAS